MTIKTIESLSLNKVLNDDMYIIPVYQRNYDWGEAQIRQLIQDILDYSQLNDYTNYYIGSLVVHEKENKLEVLDGQQRLTTLSLLAIYLKHRLTDNLINYERVNLGFESRSKSESTIQKLYEIFCVSDKKYSTPEKFSETLSSFDNKSTNSSMINGFKTINKVINDLFTAVNSVELERFADYLINQVKILPVHVPKNTDVTHYFEVMNNRGEQLEKHEIVKANLLSAVQNDNQAMAIIQRVWLVCSDMSRYIQTGFTVDERKALFGDDAQHFLVDSYECLTQKLNTAHNEFEPYSEESRISLDDALICGRTVSLDKDENKYSATDDEGKKERFTSVIDFPNFLMQVLRIYCKTKNIEDLPALDDKDLINSFKTYIGTSQDEVKSFIFLLFKVRYLFDRYIIKRENTNTGEGWSLKRYKYDNKQSSYVNTFGNDDDDKSDNLTCLMLLSAFHVSYPTNARKNWLAAALFWVDKMYTGQKLDEQSGTQYLEFLEQLARVFIINRYIKDEPVEYLKFMYSSKDGLKEIAKDNDVSDEDMNISLSYGRVAIFIFNYLDYLLWKNDNNIFRFSSNNSVEHFTPQHSKVGDSLEDKDLHGFGNLCLISSSENSSLSNDTPEQKARIIRDRVHNKQTSQPSLKLQKMMEMASDGNKWDVNAIREHGEEMIGILKDNLVSQSQLSIN